MPARLNPEAPVFQAGSLLQNAHVTADHSVMAAALPQSNESERKISVTYSSKRGRGRGRPGHSGPTHLAPALDPSAPSFHSTQEPLNPAMPVHAVPAPDGHLRASNGAASAAPQPTTSEPPSVPAGFSGDSSTAHHTRGRGRRGVAVGRGRGRGRDGADTRPREVPEPSPPAHLPPYDSSPAAASAAASSALPIPAPSAPTATSSAPANPSDLHASQSGAPSGRGKPRQKMEKKRVVNGIAGHVRLGPTMQSSDAAPAVPAIGSLSLEPSASAAHPQPSAPVSSSSSSSSAAAAAPAQARRPPRIEQAPPRKDQQQQPRRRRGESDKPIAPSSAPAPMPTAPAASTESHPASLPLRKETPIADTTSKPAARQPKPKRRDYEAHELAETLEAELTAQTYDCMVCYGAVLRKDRIWNCFRCFRVFHLGCIRKWATASAGVGSNVETDQGWRCPGCQIVHDTFPSAYTCFCGKQREPSWRPSGPPPHTCGELCGKPRDDQAISCSHRCNIPCHPGPCPPCPVTVNKLCCCGQSTMFIRCSAQGAGVCCTKVCSKQLSCGSHTCTAVCHTGPCQPCTQMQQQHCYCGASSREALCGSGDLDTQTTLDPGRFSCNSTCDRKLSCGNHNCTLACHKGPCPPCSLSPQLLQTCGCGKYPSKGRKSCLDPPLLCGERCNKILSCPHKSKSHRCQSQCHLGPCPPCEIPVTVSCRCGASSKEISAAEYRASPPAWLCDTVCNKLKACRRHRCHEVCCPARNDPIGDHECFVVCRKPLRCGQHFCEQLCHAGHCPPCINIVVDELVCACGKTVLHPPQPCGTPRPVCHEPCSRPRPCGHPANHNCHYDETCPPCPVLVQKKCVGGHNNLCSSTPCHVTNPTCIQVCAKLLRCGQHTCPVKCHAGDCHDVLPRELLAPSAAPVPSLAPAELNASAFGDIPVPLIPSNSCGIKCGILRECGHPCQLPCHPGQPCSLSPCQELVLAECPCGMRRAMVPCLYDEQEEFANMQQTGAAAAPRLPPKLGTEPSLSQRLILPERKQIPCDRLCPTRLKMRQTEERNQRLADALGIVTTEFSTTPRTTYSEALLAQARRNLPFIRSVEHALDALACNPKLKQHSFPPMKADERRVVQEMAQHYGLASACYDPEPHRNVVVYRAAASDPFVPHPRLSESV